MLKEPEDLGESGPLPADLQGHTILLEVTIDYPGSKISDIRICDGWKNTIHISNDVLRQLVRSSR
jgi:hypothetical protein